MSPQYLQAKSLQPFSQNSNWWSLPEDIVLLCQRSPATEFNVICQVAAPSGASEECGFALRRRRCLQKKWFCQNSRLASQPVAFQGNSGVSISSLRFLSSILSHCVVVFLRTGPQLSMKFYQRHESQLSVSRSTGWTTGHLELVPLYLTSLFLLSFLKPPLTLSGTEHLILIDAFNEHNNALNQSLDSAGKLKMINEPVLGVFVLNWKSSVCQVPPPVVIMILSASVNIT